MSDAATVMDEIKQALVEHEDLDELTLSMIPEGSRHLCVNGKRYTQWLLDQLQTMEQNEYQESRRLLAEFETMRKALTLYRDQCGDPMFQHNLELCLEQVRKS